MKSITINGSQRESVGKKATKALRNAGQVPCVLYGGDKPVHFYAEELSFSNLVYTPNAHTVVIALNTGEKYSAILQDIQFHPVTDKILHVDFYQLFDDKEITMEIPISFIGNSRGVKNGGVLRKNRRSLRVKALPANLPDFIEADITPLKIGSKLYITALQNDAYRFMHPDNTVVCLVRRSRASVDAFDEEEEEAAAEAAAAEEAAAQE
ncbi:50S ribosomal protein L25/general stress protein Ctc [Mariniflexile maritimum]|jgi:large subunit ribosomal protein L25|uniref:50S ribosomal protein L25/general stress protein Ctc n=1 Tax=Mariniflexile maritimum TaxID=2682493 RepID=UPI0012F6DCC4|nr:50S ribosomal protein L25/general stress protein Ctc [Mariniflexile maritimum]MCB0449563.1 50S ribosomal protein L25/general stress protein Ctc [Confluentibacter sp.]HMQ43550.1 50S ribosomal protein L25/general stress protein Ctc [Mariniflexile sp.]HMR17021.1 50S ribosomal protein L25/general stress protein Ctc [Mariniflexile sp.]